MISVKWLKFADKFSDDYGGASAPEGGREIRNGTGIGFFICLFVDEEAVGSDRLVGEHGMESGEDTEFMESFS